MFRSIVAQALTARSALLPRRALLLGLAFAGFVALAGCVDVEPQGHAACGSPTQGCVAVGLTGATGPRGCTDLVAPGQCLGGSVAVGLLGPASGSVAVAGAGGASGTGAAVSGSGGSSGYAAVSGVGASQGVVAVSGVGSSYGMVAVSGAGDATSDTAAVSVAGNARHTDGDLAFGGPTSTCNGQACHAVGLGSAYGHNTATSVSGSAGSYLVATSGTGSASAVWVATSGTGSARGVVATSGTGTAYDSAVATSGVGSAYGGLLATSGTGYAQCRTSLCVAASGTGIASCPSGCLAAVSGCQTVASATGTGLACSHHGFTAPSASAPTLGPDADGDRVPASVTIHQQRTTYQGAGVQQHAAAPIVVSLDPNDRSASGWTTRTTSHSAGAPDAAVIAPGTPRVARVVVAPDPADPSRATLRWYVLDQPSPVLDGVPTLGLISGPVEADVGGTSPTPVGTDRTGVSVVVSSRVPGDRSLASDPAWVASPDAQGATLSATIGVHHQGSTAASQSASAPVAGFVLGSV